jgi:hypothetical protein
MPVPSGVSHRPLDVRAVVTVNEVLHATLDFDEDLSDERRVRVVLLADPNVEPFGPSC